MKFIPQITEKSMKMVSDEGLYTFKVGKDMNKNKIKVIIENVFNVKVVGVRTANFSGKKKRRGKHLGRTRGFKKAVVRLKKGDKISEFKVSK